MADEKEKNPYSNMGFVKLWLISLVMFPFFPVTLPLCLIFLGPKNTWLLIKALIRDAIEGALIMLLLLATAIFAMWYLLRKFFGYAISFLF